MNPSLSSEHSPPGGGPASHSSTSSSKLWQRYDDALVNSIDYLDKRSKGEIKSLKTPWNSFNKIGFNGIEWQSLYVIGARPGVGKTLFVQSLARGLQKLNPEQKFSVLHFQFEMLARNMAVRELSAATGMDIRYMQSAQDKGTPPLSRPDLEKLKAYAYSQKGRNEYIVDKPLTAKQVAHVIETFYRETKLPIVVTIDHTLLIRQDASEKSRQDTLQAMSIMMTEVKNKLPVTFLVLTQLNREMENPERHKPGALSNYPSEADVFGSDYLLQCADAMVVFNNPAKFNLKYYGPHRHEVYSKDLMAMHVLKNRFGTHSIEWFEADYPTMTFREVPEPRRVPKSGS